MNSRFGITRNCIIKKCNTNQQNCICCGQPMTKGLYAITMNNIGDRLQLKKNLWLHIACAPELFRKIEEAVDKHGLAIAALQL